MARTRSRCAAIFGPLGPRGTGDPTGAPRIDDRYAHGHVDPADEGGHRDLTAPRPEPFIRALDRAYRAAG